MPNISKSADSEKHWRAQTETAMLGTSCGSWPSVIVASVIAVCAYFCDANF